MFCSIPQKIGTLVASGLLTATLGFVLYITFPMLMESEIKKKLVLKEGSQSYEYWKDIPVPIYLEFYFFNVTNTEEVYNFTNKPILEEVGPYTFRESREKVNVTWRDNGTLSYKQIKRWYFQPDRTNGSLQDYITTLNVPMMAAAAKGKEMDMALVYYALEEFFDHFNSTWFVTKTVDELLFTGYEDPLMKAAKAFMNMPYDKFGWFYERNGTDDGEFVVYTGADDIQEVDQIYTWNKSRTVTTYDPPCNMINGSAGDIWPPNQTGDNLELFVTDICRSLSFKYLKKLKVKNIPAYRYWADNTQLDNGKYNPENKCFCSDDICLPAGSINVSACKFDAPAVVSYPHFLYADSIYSQGVIGMKPDPKLHQMYLDIVPEMGIPISVAARMQINIVFEGVKDIRQFSNISRRIYFPVLWFSETAMATDSIVDQLRLVLYTLPLICNISSFIMISVGCFLVLAAFVLSLLYAAGKITDMPGTKDDALLEDESSQKEVKVSE
ncbi:scavenger receptor class B member 1-like isoform X2 [Uloborus diversus]|uniref:scavenger receptor class B member 1-like isoform X2 n=2 Tax=Uloborus diversus TaxID=327109 RepID=UPI0024092B0D|nr:scavenger receptor class B member 1-like isoform X2 [Uloborus diversus]